LLNILDKDLGLQTLIKKGDVFILDRGFRDAVDDLEMKYNLKVRKNLKPLQ
jgi:hypothetical protein